MYGFHNKQGLWMSGYYSMVQVCEVWMLAPFDGSQTADEFLKDRLSLVELGFRQKEEQLAKQLRDAERPTGEVVRINALMGSLGANFDPMNIVCRSLKKFQADVEELNARFRQASAPLHYHNGFIQISRDELMARELETPFWARVGQPRFANVDIDMKEAIDLRDTGGRDPAFYAARALESTIKIISDEKGWTHGGERGAHNYIDNLSSNRSGFIEPWEAKFLKDFFTSVRNPLGHGAGSQPMVSLSNLQSEWAIDFVMVWIKTLIARM
jgi:hypothetical protein